MTKARETTDWKEKLASLRPTLEGQVEAQKPRAPETLKTPSPTSPTKHKRAPKRRVPPKPAVTVNRHPSGLSSVPTRPGRFAPEIPDRVGPKLKPVAQIKTPADLKGKEALQFVRQRVDLSALKAETLPPRLFGKEEQRNLQAVLAEGAHLLSERPAPDEEGNFIGVDFGTSSTKIVVRQQGAGNLAYALPTPKALRVTERRRSQEHLWRSVVWFHPEQETFSLAPEPGFTPIQGFKTGLIGADGHRMTSVPGVTHAHASTAYLAMLIAYVLGHHRLNAPPGFDRARHYSRFHFGIPVASKDEPGVCKVFQRVLNAAFFVAPRAACLKLDDVRDALVSATSDNEINTETPFIIYEELAGVIAGYKASPDHRTGPHLIVDVGASTLDVATFHIPAGDEKVLVFMSGVDLLGAEALRCARSKGVPDPAFKAACNEHTQHILWITTQRKDRDFQRHNGIAKPLLFVGGGRLTDVHKELYSHYPKGLEAPLRTPSPGPGLKFDPKTDIERLLLAWGLSQDEIDIPEIKPPSQIEDEVRRHRDYRDRFIDKDMC